MSLIPLDRTCYELNEKGERVSSESLTLVSLLTMSAWALLGEPGMGKTTALTMLAGEEQRCFVRARDLSTKAAQDFHTARCILVDGLDEVSQKLVIRDKLAQLCRDITFASIGLSSRYADWFEKRDRPDFKVVHRDFRVFVLEPLSESQTLSLATHFLQEAQSTQAVLGFIAKARQRGLGVMLGNPQLMAMLVKAIVNNKGDAWPQSRSEVYDLACKQMLSEHNPNHRQTNDLAHDLSVAGELCAIYLLSQSGAIQTRVDASGQFNRIVEIPHLPVTALRKGKWAELIKSKLFVKTLEHTFEPIHRTVAEYLAANHLAGEIATGKLTHTRVLSWFVVNEGIPEHLSGLAGWLVSLTQSTSLAQDLIAADPNCILNYTDLTKYSIALKEFLLQALDNAEIFRQYLQPEATSNFSPLTEPGMEEVLSKYFNPLEKEQSFKNTNTIDVLLRSLLTQTATANGLIQVNKFLPLLEKIVRNTDWHKNEGRWAIAQFGHHTRGYALEALIAAKKNLGDLKTLRALLQDLTQTTVADSELELRGMLLRVLYPDVLAASDLFDYFYAADQTTHRHFGMFEHFWFKLRQHQHSDSDLINLANGVCKWLTKIFDPEGQNRYAPMPEHLDIYLLKALYACSDKVSIDVCSTWLEQLLIRGISSSINAQDETHQWQAWLQTHTELLAEVQQHWLIQCKSDEVALHSIYTHRLSYLAPPLLTTQRWSELAKYFEVQGDSIKANFCAKQAQPPTIDPSIPDYNKRWRMEAQAREQKMQIDCDNIVQAWRGQIALVAAGKQFQVLNLFAWHWAVKNSGGGYVSHDPMGKRLHDAVVQDEKNAELRTAIEKGIAQCVFEITPDLEQVTINAHAKGETLMIELPAIVGAINLYSTDPSRFAQLTNAQLQVLSVFYFYQLVRDCNWLDALCQSKPEIVCAAWLLVTKQSLSANKNDSTLPWLYELVNQPRFKSVAALALPELLRVFPVKTNTSQHADYARLIYGCWKHANPDLVFELCQLRWAKRSMPITQRVYCILAGALFAPSVIQAKFASNLFAAHGQKLFDAHLIAQVLHEYRMMDEAMHQIKNGITIETMLCLFEILAPITPQTYPLGAFWAGALDQARDFLYAWLNIFENHASQMVVSRMQEWPTIAELENWHAELKIRLQRRAQKIRNQSSSTSAIEICNALNKSAPSNPQDLLAIALDVLTALQNDIKGNSGLNYRDAYWDKDKHKNENYCRDALSREIKLRLSQQGISLITELQHKDQTRCDIELIYKLAADPEMRLPIEVKGDWHKELWSAPEAQLAKLYMNHPDCNRLGIYLVLWTGEIEKMKPAFRKAFPNGNPPKDMAAFKTKMLEHISTNLACTGITLVVLDVAK